MENIENPQREKMTYEQLENVAHQLSEQSRQLYASLQEANLENMFKRLDYLFKVLENAHHFNEEFVFKCSKEIEQMISIPENRDENIEEDTKKEVEE